MKFEALRAVIVRGDRIEKGEIVDINESLAQSIGDNYLKPVDEVVKVEAKEPEVEETDLESLSHAELKKKAEELGLSTRGSKADIIERISLANPNSDEKSEE